MIILRLHINSQLWVRSQFHNQKMKILILVSLFSSLLDVGSGRHFQPEFGYLYGEMRTTEATMEKLDKMVMMCVCEIRRIQPRRRARLHSVWSLWIIRVSI